MLRIVEDLLGRALLDDSPGVHHANPVAHRANHAKVVGDQQHRSSGFGPQRTDEVEHFRFNRGVEAGRRLIEDEQFRRRRKRHRDDDTLEHAARELVRIAVHHASRVGDTDLGERFVGGCFGLLFRLPDELEALGDLPADPGRRVQRCGRVLVDHRRVTRPKRSEFLRRHLGHVDADGTDAPVRDQTVRWQVAQRRIRRGRLATTRLADQTIRLAWLHVERDTAQHLSRGASHNVGHLEVGHLECRRLGVDAEFNVLDS